MTGIHRYTNMGTLKFIDIASIQAVVCPVFNRAQGGIINHSGELAHAWFMALGSDMGRGGGGEYLDKWSS
jgi:hypothetical protein